MGMADNQSTTIRAEFDFAVGTLPTVHAFWMGNKRIEVLELLDRWISQDRWYFKIRTADTDIFILDYDCPTGGWHIKLYCRQDYLAGEYSDTPHRLPRLPVPT